MNDLKNITLNEIVGEFFDLEEKNLPEWLDSEITSKSAILKSYLWTSGIFTRIRLCELKIENKFEAQTLVIYPDSNYDYPIFGTEYVNISNKKYLAAIDFHPVSSNKDYLTSLKEFPNLELNSSRFYNLSEFFSNKMWIKKDKKDFYDEYVIWVRKYLQKYLNINKLPIPVLESQKKYNYHMASNDPAFGILKSYFGKEFSTRYINDFLFSL